MESSTGTGTESEVGTRSGDHGQPLPPDRIIDRLRLVRADCRIMLTSAARAESALVTVGDLVDGQGLDADHWRVWMEEVGERLRRLVVWTQGREEALAEDGP